MMKKFFAAALALALSANAAIAQIPGNFAPGTVYGNSSASARPPRAETVPNIFDRAFCSTQGGILTRNATTWLCLSPGSVGRPLVSGGAGADLSYAVLGIPGGGTNCAAASGTCLDNITGFSSTGILARTGAAAYAFRTMTGTAAEIAVGNGDGVAGNPTFSLPTALTFTGKTVTGGSFAAVAALGIRSTGGGAFDLQIANSETLTANRSLDISLNNAARAINLGGNLSFGGGLTFSGAFSTTFTVGATTSVALPETGKLEVGENLGLSAAVASNALTITIKDAAGADPSATSPVTLDFRSATLTTGTPSRVAHTAVASLVISSGSTLGIGNGTPFRLWIVDFNDAGTLRLGVAYVTSPTGMMIALNDGLLASATAEGGAGGADTAGIFYAGSTITSKAYRIIGYMEWADGLATAGTWDVGPTKIQLYGPGIPKPGDVVQRVRGTTTTSTTTTSTTYQNTGVSVAITPTSKINLIEVSAVGAGQIGGTAENILADLHRDSTIIGVGITMGTAANLTAMIANEALDFPSLTSAITYMVKVKSNGGQSITYPAAGHTEYGAISCKEIMS
jgi:hypothetical protein